MSKQNDYGYVISTSDWYVIREKIKDGKLEIYVHHKGPKGEELPRGYLLGSNALFFEKRKEAVR